MAMNGFYTDDNAIGWIGKFFYRHDKKYTIVFDTLTLKGSNIKLFKGNSCLMFYKFSQGLKCNITINKVKRVCDIMERIITPCQ